MSTWEDPQFILSVLKSNQVENSLEMIPERWVVMEGTPFLELSMQNGKKLYIHKTLKRVFFENPLMKKQQVDEMHEKQKNQKELMSKLKAAKIRRMQLKQQKNTEIKTEQEVSIYY